MLVHVLGRIACVDRAGAVVDLSGHEAMVLSQLVAAEGHQVGAERLIEALWGASPPKTARSAFHVYVAKLRSRLPEGSITTIGSSYRLDLDPALIDCCAFEKLTRAGDDALDVGDYSRVVATTRLALDLWVDPPFGALADSPHLTPAAEQLSELRRRAEETLSAAQLRLGSAPDIERLRDLVDSEPLRERRWGHLMLALYRQGRQVEALRTYQELRTTLADELGIEPGPALRQLDVQIVRQDPVLLGGPGPQPDVARADRMASAAISADLTPLVGRHAEIDQLCSVVAAERLVSITGQGGVGKSRLAVTVARRFQEAFTGPIAVVALSTVERGSDIDDVVASALGVGARPGVSARESIVDLLANGPALLVLDNCEHVVASTADLVRELLSANALLKVLATTQHPLDVAGEVVWRLHPLALPDSDTDPAAAESVQLFLDAARRAAPNRPFGPNELAHVADVCRILDGLPLAIELAAGRTATLDPTELRAVLRDPMGALRSERRLTPSHHRTLESLVAWSYELLDDDERRALVAVAMFPAGVTLDTFTHVLGSDGGRAGDLLDQLSRKSLVSSAPTASPGRHVLLPAVASYVASHPHASDDDAAALRRRQVEWALRTGRYWGPLVYTATEKALPALESELPNLRAAVRWALDHEMVDEALRIGHSLLWFWTFRGHLADGRETFSAVLSDVGRLPSRVRARALHGAGVIAAFDTEYERAFALLGESAGLFASMADPSNLAWTRFWLGRTITAQTFAGLAPPSRLVDADIAYAEAAEIFLDREDVVGTAFNGMFHGWNTLMLGDPSAARDMLDDALELALLGGARQPEAMLNGMIALSEVRDGDVVTARARADYAVSVLDELGDRMNGQICRAVAALAALAAGDIDGARVRVLDAVTIQQRFGSREWDSFTLSVALAILDRLDAPSESRVIAASLDRHRPYWRGTHRVLFHHVGGNVTERPAGSFSLPIAEALARSRRALESLT